MTEVTMIKGTGTEGSMTRRPVLITSFRPWRSHQKSNSSDELIDELQRNGQLPPDSIWIRNLPVSFELAPIRLISELYYHQPRIVICCGMAEKRACLSIEKYAKKRTSDTDTYVLETAVDTHRLLKNTCLSEISNDAGAYVCNDLYYSVLEKIKMDNLPTDAVFLHIPVLIPATRAFILKDFLSVLDSV